MPARPTNGRGGNMSQLETNRSFTKACPRIEVAIEYGFSLPILPINLQRWSIDVSQTSVAIPARCLFRFPAMGVGSQFGTGPQGLVVEIVEAVESHHFKERCSTPNLSDLHHPRSLFGEHGELLFRWVPLVVWRTRIDMTKLYQALCHFTRIWQHNSEFRGAQKNGVHWLAEFRALKMFNYYELRRFHSCAVKSSLWMVSVGWLDHVRSAYSCGGIAFSSWWPVSSFPNRWESGLDIQWGAASVLARMVLWTRARLWVGGWRFGSPGSWWQRQFFHKRFRSKQGGWFSDV